MYYTDIDVAHAWANNRDNCYGRNHFTHSGCELRSFSTVIGERLEMKNNQVLYLVQDNYYSASTSKHINYMMGAIPCASNTHIVNVAKYGFIYGWSGAFSGVSLLNAVEHLITGFTYYLNKIKNSSSLSDESISSPKAEIETIIKLSKSVTWSKIKNITTYGIAWSSSKDLEKNEKLCRKVAKALANKDNTSIQDIFIDVFGQEEWDRYFYRTRTARKARETRRAKEIPGYIPVDIDAIINWSSDKEKKYSKRERAKEARHRREEERMLQRWEAEAKARREERMKKELPELLDKIEKWRNGEDNYLTCRYEDSDLFIQTVFHGGNTLLRFSHGKINTSKGKTLEIEECKRLWKCIQQWHKNEQSFHREIATTTVDRWPISSYQNDILTAGCHSIAYQEMKQIAQQLNF